MNIEDKIVKSEPFLRWAGGKRWFLKYIDQIIPEEFNNYHEPFLGGGAVYFHLEHKKIAFLSDLNPELIETYSCVKNKLDKVITTLSSFKNTETQYYKIRSKKFDNDFERAAQFIYLNKTSFNGIYRVNKNGDYNVPYGFRKNTKIVQKENLKIVSSMLQNAQLINDDFSVLLNNINENDFVFIDPPYTVAHENNGFIEYNQKIFSLEDQKRLCTIIEKIKDVGAFYILTNAKHDSIKKIYSKIDKPIVLSRNSTIGGKGARREQFKEYIFTNCI